ncbi:Class II aldolase [Venustampulla echinocandica]|uniref:Class II aldolase n=1 Tax=Venustampulla echinocandica TaxID=2656787 RepID=A0A370TGR3_9HELO|nr:Class II aldolase [Venustampulla echinocandica]RDL34373.1 Class II aldolase [Venustampulla echinocandica]
MPPTALADENSLITETTHDTSKNGLKQRPTETPIEAMSHGPVSLPGLPVFPDLKEKRKWVLEHLAGAFRIFARHGYTEGLSGHISVRDPINARAFWINPLGVHFAMLKVSDMLLLDMYTSEVLIAGKSGKPANATGFMIHSAIHRARPDVHAICHAHSPNARAWTAFGKPLEMINQDVCNVYRVQALYNSYGGIALNGEEGERIAESLGEKNKVAFLLNHGLLTVGGTVDEASYLFRLVERSCEVQLLVEAAVSKGGLEKRIIDDREASYNFATASEAESLYCEFQPEYELETMLSGGDFKR